MSREGCWTLLPRETFGKDRVTGTSWTSFNYRHIMPTPVSHWFHSWWLNHPIPAQRWRENMADRCVRHRQSLELIGRTPWNQQNIRLQGPTHGKNLLSGSDWQHKNVLACRSFFPKMFDGREAERLGWLGSEADQAFMSPWYDIRCASHLYGCVMSASFYHQSLPLDTAHSGFLWSHGLHLQSALLEPRNQTANHQSPLTHTSLDWYAHNAVN